MKTEITGNLEYIKAQAKRALTTPLASNKEDFLWRILSNNQEPNLNPFGTLTPEQWEKALAIAKEVTKV